MVDILSMHVAFLLFESIFCFLAAILCALKNSRDKKAGVTVTILNVMAGLLLFFDFFAYVFDGREGAFCNFMEKAANLAVFLLCDLFLGGVVVYTGILVATLVLYAFVKEPLLLWGLLGMTIMMVIGVWDDISDLPA